ncbi:hypothetical protein jhhlp_002000 [Lomentospora prolificans]|uniref:Intradiol ring-cleavage dioxygenases domain-containing protein n=1 Tax=Lomentospora prolificans TaxID=41688 RepID=A0A2N3NCT2_9PEZI|nr:hypothetical protein jhhlp_002000 [Lomentospora prolificans]
MPSQVLQDSIKAGAAPAPAKKTIQPSPGPSHGYDPNFTDQVIAATGPNAHRRLAQVMPSLVRHLHDFAREVNLTVSEWKAAVDFINAAGQMSNDKRNETQLVCDILGLESLVDEISSKILQEDASPGSIASTPSAILGPFYRKDAPVLPNGSSIVAPETKEAFSKDLTYFSGRVLDNKGDPIPDAVIDIWHTAPNGMYEQQDPDQPEFNLRGRFRTDTSGRYSLYCLRPAPYPVPDDGPGGLLLKLLDRHPWRPAHIHVIIIANGFRPLTTQLFDKGDKYLKNDTVFAAKEGLEVDFIARPENEDGNWTLTYDFVLSPA